MNGMADALERPKGFGVKEFIEGIVIGLLAGFLLAMLLLR